MDEEKKITYEIDGRKIRILLYRLFFQREAVSAASQKMTNHFYITFNSFDSERIEIFLEQKSNISTEGAVNIELLENAAKTFCNEVLDQQVKLDLEKRYGKIRELIVRQAFAPITIDKLSKELKNK